MGVIEELVKKDMHISQTTKIKNSYWGRDWISSLFEEDSETLTNSPNNEKSLSIRGIKFRIMGQCELIYSTLHVEGNLTDSISRSCMQKQTKFALVKGNASLSMKNINQVCLSKTLSNLIYVKENKVNLRNVYIQ